MSKKIVSAGYICLDITPVFEESKDVEIAQIFQPGKMINVGSAKMSAGGSVSNTGLGFQYFGNDVTVIAKTGNDYFGKLISNIVEQYNVKNKITSSEQCDTAYTIVMAPPGIDRMFFHCPGANDLFSCDDIDFEEVKEADLFHFGYPTIMKRMYQNPEELVEIFKKAKEAGAQTSLDLAAVEEGSEGAMADWKAISQKLLPYVDYFVPSAEELCALIDRPRYKEWMQRAAGGDVMEVLDWEKDIRPLADQLIQWGSKNVLIKCGTPGMYLRTAKQEKAEWSEKEFFEKSYKAERVCSATGAGDVSIAAFLTAVLNGYEPKRCMQLAAGAGACCVTEYDSLSGLIPFKELEKRIDNGWEKNE